MSWNCNCLDNKIDELTHFIKQSNSLILLGETRLNPNRIIKIQNFTIHWTDRPQTSDHRSEGGTAILIRREIVRQRVIIPTTLDSTTVHIKLGNSIAQISAVL